MRNFLLTTLMIAVFALVGCSGGAEPDVPAELTPELEQEILDQVEGSAAEEEGQS